MENGNERRIALTVMVAEHIQNMGEGIVDVKCFDFNNPMWQVYYLSILESKCYKNVFIVQIGNEGIGIACICKEKERSSRI